MGYHIIVLNKNDELVSSYVESEMEIAKIEGLSEKTLIFEGDENQTPRKLSEVNECKDAIDKYRAGVNAEMLFKEMANDHGLVLETLSQDIENFQIYKAAHKDEIGKSVNIKRGDFLVRNAKNIEIEVKCFRLYGTQPSQYYYLEYKQAIGHRHMDEFTGCSTLVAFYQREGDQPVANSLKMISIRKIFEENNKSVSYNQKYRTLHIPISIMSSGFELIDEVRESIKNPEFIDTKNRTEPGA